MSESPGRLTLRRISLKKVTVDEEQKEAMLIAATEKPQVIDALEQVLTMETFRAFAQTAFGPDATPVLRDLSADLSMPRQFAVFLVDYCLRSKWSLNPSLMERLLDELVGKGHGAMAGLRDRVSRGEDPNPDWLQSEWVRSELPFFSRGDSRKRIRRLLDGTEKPILLVYGLEYSGMTYTKELIDYLADENRCDFQMAYAYVAKGAGPTITPEELAETLVAQMKGPIESIPTRTTHRYEKKLCTWILNQALRTGEWWWLVLDGFGDRDLNLETATLVQELAVNMTNGVYNRGARLVLIDYRSQLPNVHRAKIEEDSLDPPTTVTAAHLGGCLRQHFKDVGQVVEDEFVIGLAQKLLVQADAQAEPRLKYLNDKIYDLRQQGLRKAGRIL